ncbi:MAG: hypothetical protein AAGA60_23470 [Cyanobacteria bacterium P01_E01_bin.42]
MFERLHDNWLFREPPNTAVLSSIHIIREKRDILYVSHDMDDGAWQFHHGNNVALENAIIVSLATIVRFDSSIQILADLPLGWVASRKSRNSEWIRSKRNIQ